MTFFWLRSKKAITAIDSCRDGLEGCSLFCASLLVVMKILGSVLASKDERLSYSGRKQRAPRRDDHQSPRP